jgi:hypothetical protein
MPSDDQDIGNPRWWGILGIFVAVLVFGLMISGSKWPAHGRDLMTPPHEAASTAPRAIPVLPAAPRSPPRAPPAAPQPE